MMGTLTDNIDQRTSMGVIPPTRTYRMTENKPMKIAAAMLDLL